MKTTRLIPLSLILILALLLGGCAAEEDSTTLSASGSLSAIQAAVAPEISGQVISIAVEEGQVVQAGETLFQIKDDYILAQRDQAAAAVQAAEAALEAAKRQADSARAQYTLAQQGGLQQDIQARQAVWSSSVPENYRPNWYFQKAELITAAQAQLDAARASLEANQASLDAELKNASSQDCIAAEARLAAAQAGYTNADQTLLQVTALNNDYLTSAATDTLDAARAELDAALLNYDHMLTTTAAENILEARAKVTVAQVAVDTASSALLSLQTGDQSAQVQAAFAAQQAAESLVAQAEAGVAQARQALQLADLQLERAAVKAPLDGVLLSRSLEVGELAAAGGAVMQIAQLDTLDLIVYLPEDQYGRVGLGDNVLVSVDSYTGQQFSGQIVHISDQAEYTPRNVQTEQGRKATVYAVKVRIPNPDHLLKPGMPADALFSLR